MTCLIVDDNAMARAALRHLIADLDFLDLREACEDALFFQALGDYVSLITPEKRFTLYTKMKAIENRLLAHRFIRTHRSYIVAIGKIDNIEENSIQIGKHLIPISDTYRARVISQLNFL